MNNWVFLDQDGVVNNQTTNDIILLNDDPSTPICGINHRVLTKFFNLIDAKIVLISAWGLSRTPEENQKYIDELNYGDRIVDNINTSYGRTSDDRLEQIHNYLDSHPEIDKFIIIDDEFADRYGACPRLKNNFHKVNSVHGFIIEDLFSSLEVLYNNHSPIVTEESIVEFEKKFNGKVQVVELFIKGLRNIIGSEFKSLKFDTLIYLGGSQVVKNYFFNCLFEYYQIVLRGSKNEPFNESNSS